MVPYLFDIILIKIKSPLLNFVRRNESYNFGVASLIPKKKGSTSLTSQINLYHICLPPILSDRQLPECLRDTYFDSAP